MVMEILSETPIKQEEQVKRCVFCNVVLDEDLDYYDSGSCRTCE